MAWGSSKKASSIATVQGLEPSAPWPAAENSTHVALGRWSVVSRVYDGGAIGSNQPAMPNTGTTAMTGAAKDSGAGFTGHAGQSSRSLNNQSAYFP